MYLIALLSLYKWTIVSGMVAAFALNFIGTQLAMREKAMQTLCVGQGATVGVLLGMVTSFHSGGDGKGLLPLLMALTGAVLTLVITDFATQKRIASKNTYFAFFFSLLMALSYLLTSIFGGLQSHMTQIYFGDLATLTTTQSLINLAIALPSAWLLLYFRHAILDKSFETAIFGNFQPLKLNLGEVIYRLLSILIIALSIQFLGFLFTISMLFLPTSLVNFLEIKTVKRHLIISSAIAVLGTLFGFILSLIFSQLPTVPLIVALMAAVGMWAIAYKKSASLNLHDTGATPLASPLNPTKEQK